ncbi:MAG TPA: CsbD family protein [Polyangiaceae bacterium]
MNWDLIEGKWKELRGNVRSKWGKLTDDDLETVAGKRDALVGRIQQRYGMNRDAAEAEVDGWIKQI